jgi:hypothetical protein
MDDVRVNGNTDTVLKNVPAIFDTGSNYIFGDSKRVSELYRRLDGTLMEFTDFNFYHREFRLRLNSVPCLYRQPAVPCKFFPTQGFTFGGRTFKIAPEVLRLQPIEEGSPNCFGAIIAS